MTVMADVTVNVTAQVLSRVLRQALLRERTLRLTPGQVERVADATADARQDGQRHLIRGPAAALTSARARSLVDPSSRADEREVTGMGEWDATTYDGKATILRVVRDEAEKFIALASDPQAWDRETSCNRWTTRDVVGHIVDTTEGYFTAFDAARSHTDPAAPFGLAAMSQVAGDRALGFRDVPQAELMERLSTDLDKCMEMLDGVGADEWSTPDGRPPLHGPGARVLLRGRAVDGLRRALVGPARGQRTGARDVRRRGRPAGSVHARALAVDDPRGRRHVAVPDRHPRERRAQRRRPGG